MKYSKNNYPLNAITYFFKDSFSQEEIAKLSEDSTLSKQWSNVLDYLGYNDRDKEMVRMRYEDGLKLKDIGEHFGISGERVRDVTFKILGRRLKSNEDDIKYLIFNGLEALYKRNDAYEIRIENLPLTTKLKQALLNSDVRTLKDLKNCDPLFIVKSSQMDKNTFKHFIKLMDECGMVFEDGYYERMNRAIELKDFYENSVDLPDNAVNAEEILEAPQIVTNPSVEDMPLSSNTKKILLKSNIKSLNDLLECDPIDIANLQSMRMRNLKEYIDMMTQFGMPIDKEQIDQMKKLIQRRNQMTTNKDLK